MENKNLNAYEFPNAKRTVVCGDIHGAFTELVFRCCVQYEMTDTLIIVAGDCGFGFERSGYYEDVYKKCNKRLSKANNWLVIPPTAACRASGSQCLLVRRKPFLR